MQNLEIRLGTWKDGPGPTNSLPTCFTCNIGFLVMTIEKFQHNVAKDFNVTFLQRLGNDKCNKVKLITIWVAHEVKISNKLIKQTFYIYIFEWLEGAHNIL